VVDDVIPGTFRSLKSCAAVLTPEPGRRSVFRGMLVLLVLSEI
jgi:hypothetical protein